MADETIAAGEEKPTEEKPKANLVATVLTVAVLALGGNQVYDAATNEKQADEIIKAYEIVRDSGAVKLPPKAETEIAERYVVTKDTTGKTIDSVLAPARIDPIIDKINAIGVQTTGDTLQLILINKSTGKSLVTRDYAPSAGCDIVLKAQFFKGE